MATKAQLVRRLFENDCTDDTEIVGTILHSIVEDGTLDFTAEELLDIIADS